MSSTVTTQPQPPADLLVAGAGLAGLYAALRAAALGASVRLVTKGSLRASNSFHAQGGVAAAIGPDDDPALHREDTLRVGRGLCDPAAVEVLVSEGPARIHDLIALGVRFDTDATGRPALGREGGHGRRRILHAGGAATGAAISEQLITRVRREPLIEVLEHTAVIALIADGERCGGAWVLGHDELRAVRARMTLIATGGAAALYSRSTNPPGALGDGIAIAHRAGATVADMEFVQFHPTALAAGDRAFLISEAVRGEGAYLVGDDGDRFMAAEHPEGELAPRDVVARAIQRRLAAGEATYLTLGHLDPAMVRGRFPNLVEGAARAGFDLTRDRVPVSPAAHYLMGGIATDLWGTSSLPGLYSSGECASSGVHGANRLASNSLLECFVFSHRAVDAGLAHDSEDIDALPPDRPLARAPLAELRRRMWCDAGPVRDAAGLSRLVDWLDERPSSNPVLAARLIAAAALRRTETRGAHVRSDFPAENPDLAHRLSWPAQPSAV
ncbi:MAG: L-aspartate oxidase [Gaiellales bacterium]|jgi:L-aspartate oxidase|nr:L-aspartate oxidase [Gaiellales bacterium]